MIMYLYVWQLLINYSRQLLRQILSARTYLSYVAVICIVPALVCPVTNVGSVVSAHRVTRVHHHSVQSVLAVILEEQMDL